MSRFTVTIVHTFSQDKGAIRVNAPVDSSDREVLGLALQKLYGKTAFFQENRDKTGDGSRLYGQVFRRHRGEEFRATSLTGCIYADVTGGTA